MSKNSNGGCASIVIGVAVLFFMYFIAKPAFWFCLVIFGIIAAIILIQKNKEGKQAHEKKEIVKEALLKNNFPIKECNLFNYISGIPLFPNKAELFTYASKDALYFLDIEKGKYALPISNIYFYALKGDLKTETEFIGKKKQDPVGTMITEGLFGTAAAMKNNQQLANVKSIDERRTIIKANIDGKGKFIFFEKGNFYNYLLERIPEKEQSFADMK